MNPQVASVQSHQFQTKIQDYSFSNNPLLLKQGASSVQYLNKAQSTQQLHSQILAKSQNQVITTTQFVLMKQSNRYNKHQHHNNGSVDLNFKGNLGFDEGHQASHRRVNSDKSLNGNQVQTRNIPQFIIKESGSFGQEQMNKNTSGVYQAQVNTNLQQQQKMEQNTLQSPKCQTADQQKRNSKRRNISTFTQLGVDQKRTMSVQEGQAISQRALQDLKRTLGQILQSPNSKDKYNEETNQNVSNNKQIQEQLQMTGGNAQIYETISAIGGIGQMQRKESEMFSIKNTIMAFDDDPYQYSQAIISSSHRVVQLKNSQDKSQQSIKHPTKQSVTGMMSHLFQAKVGFVNKPNYAPSVKYEPVKVIHENNQNHVYQNLKVSHLKQSLSQASLVGSQRSVHHIQQRNSMINSISSSNNNHIHLFNVVPQQMKQAKQNNFKQSRQSMVFQTPSKKSTDFLEYDDNYQQISSQKSNQKGNQNQDQENKKKLISQKKPINFLIFILNFQDYYQSFTLRKYKSNSDLLVEKQEKRLQNQQKIKNLQQSKIQNSDSKRNHSQAQQKTSPFIGTSQKLPHLSQMEKDENNLQRLEVKQIKQEINTYQQVATSYKYLRKAFENENLINYLQKDLDQEEKRIKMLQRNPNLAQKLYPFNKRMGIEQFLNRDKVQGDSEEAAKNDDVHIKINEKFFQSQLDPMDERVQSSLKFLEKNDYKVDFKRIRQQYEGTMWKQDLKQAIDMKKFVQENLNKNMMEQRWTLNLMRKRGKNPKNLMLIN